MAVLQRTATYATRCFKCGENIKPGDRIFWSSGDHAARHMKCPVPDAPKIPRKFMEP